MRQFCVPHWEEIKIKKSFPCVGCDSTEFVIIAQKCPDFLAVARVYRVKMERDMESL